MIKKLFKNIKQKASDLIISKRFRTLVQETLGVLIFIFGVSFLGAPTQLNESIPFFLLFYLFALAILEYILYKLHNRKFYLICLFYWLLCFLFLTIFLFSSFHPISIAAFALAAYSLGIALKCILIIKIGFRSGDSKAFLIMNMVTHIFLVVAIIYSFFSDGVPLTDISVLSGILFILDGIILFVPPFSEYHDIMLTRILNKTHTKEVFGGLILMIVIFSFIFQFAEPNIKSFGDGMWYCFAVVTTIGFGDYVAASPIGRVLTVFIGIYGVVVVALLTSIIVNIYNEKKEEDNSKKESDKPNKESDEPKSEPKTDLGPESESEPKTDLESDSKSESISEPESENVTDSDIDKKD